MKCGEDNFIAVGNEKWNNWGGEWDKSRTFYFVRVILEVEFCENYVRKMFVKSINTELPKRFRFSAPLLNPDFPKAPSVKF
jgi:hypothetical protein